MTQNLEVALALKIAQTGLSNLTEVIDQLNAAGVETDELSQQADELNQAFDKFSRDNDLSDALDEIAKNAANAADRSDDFGNQIDDAVNPQNRLTSAIRDTNAAMAKADTAMASNVRSQSDVASGADKISTQLGQLKTVAIAAYAVDKISDNLAEITRLADGYTDLTSRLKLAVGEGAAFDQSLADVRETANATGTSLESIGDLYTKISRSAEELGKTQAEVAQVTDTISKSFVVSGASAQEADAAITQLSQGLASGVLRGDEFNSVMEQSPRLAQAMADSLGVTTGELREMAGEGQLTAETVINALQQQSDAINAEFEAMPDTVGRATQRLTNEWQLFLGNLNETTGASELAISALNGIAENLDAIASLAGTVATVGTAAIAVKFTPAIVAAGKELITAAASGDLFADSLGTVDSKGRSVVDMAGLLKQGLAVAITTYTIQQALDLASAYSQLRDAQKELVDATVDLDESQQQLANRYADISEQTGVTVTSMKELDAAIAAGSIVIDEASGKYLSAAQHQEQLAEKTAQAAEAAASGQVDWKAFKEVAKATSDELGKTQTEGGNLADVLNTQLKAALGSGIDGMAGFVGGLQDAQTNVDGLDNAVDNWINGLNATDLGLFQFTVQSAFESSTLSARQFADYSDKVVSASLTNLGLNAEAALGKITPATETAIQDLSNLIGGIDKLGLTAEQQSSVIEKALIAAIPKAQTTADIEIIANRLESLDESGRLGADAVERITAALKEQQSQIHKTIPGIQSLEEAWEQLGLVDPEHLKRQAEQAREAFEKIRASGLYTAEQIAEAWHAWADSASEVGDPVVDAMIEIESAAYGAHKSMDAMADSASDASDNLDDLTDSASTASDDIDDLADSMDRSKKSAESSADAADDLGGSYLSAAGKAGQLYEQLEQLLGPEAAAEYGSALKQMAEDTDALAAAAEKSEAALNRLSKAGALALNGFARAFQDAEIAYHEAVLAADSARGPVVSMASDFDALSEAGQNAGGVFVGVGIEAGRAADDVDDLADSTDDAADAFERMSDSAKSSLDSVRDSIFRLADDQERLIESRYEQDKAALQEQLAEAREQGNDQAVSDTQSALQLLKVYRNLQLKNEALADAEERLSAARESGNEDDIRALESEVASLEKAAESAAESAANQAANKSGSSSTSSSSPSNPSPPDITHTTDPVQAAPVRTIRFEFPSGSSVDVVDNGSDENLISEMESFAQRSGA